MISAAELAKAQAETAARAQAEMANAIATALRGAPLGTRGYFAVTRSDVGHWTVDVRFATTPSLYVPSSKPLTGY